MDVVTGIVVAAVTALVLVGGGVTIGFVTLFRRRSAAADPDGSPAFTVGSASLDDLTARAGSMLVRTDDGVRTADNELGFAIAQFGAERSQEYGLAISAARKKVAEAFRLKQALDDSIPDSDRQQREWTLQIIALCGQADTVLTEQDSAFARLRKLEVDASGYLTDLRSRIAESRHRLAASRVTLAGLEASYSPGVVRGISTNVGEAEAALTEAVSIADDAASGVRETGVSAVSGTLQLATQAAGRADQLLNAVDRTERDLDAARTAVTALRSTARADLAEARTQRDSAPDAETGRAIIDAMAAVDSALVTVVGPADPVADLDRIGADVARLDLALASARNQAERLSHARAAYAGTLVSAASQIAVVRELVGASGGGVTVRTRLAEAERQYGLAQVETDPVAALDTARRAVTLARDADALARFIC